MDELVARHRKEQKDLQARVTQKKKAASKKTWKGVNDECERLEQELKDRHADEIAQLQSDGSDAKEPESDSATDGQGADELVDNNDDLLASIVGSGGENGVKQLNVNGESENKPGQDSQQSRKPNRQKARLARRAAEQDAARAQAAEEAANMPDLKQQERNKMLEEAKKHGLVEKEVAANGHCLYLAMADQMVQQKLSLDPAFDPSKVSQTANGAATKMPDYKKVRAAAANYIEAHPQDFEPFLEEPLNEYIHKIRDTGEWGGQLELTALAKVYKIDIKVLQATGRMETIESGADGQDIPKAWLAYYRHGFGLGEHYNSLRQKPTAADT